MAAPLIDPWTVFRGPSSGAALRRDGDALVAPGERWPIVRGVPRFVPGDAYAASFGFEWNAHPTTQLDAATGGRMSEEHLVAKTGLSPEQVRGKLVLDAGVGAGRYADVLSRWGATVIGVDLSRAVDAAQANLGARSDVVVAQADLFQLPFAPATFDLAISLGVLHHTPDTRAAFERLVPLVRPGGEVCVWVYPPTRHYRLRQAWVPFTSRIPPEWFHAWCRWFVPFAQRRSRSVAMQYVYELFEWSAQGRGLENDVLDTFDAYSPRFHGVHGEDEVVAWFEAAGLVDVRTFPWPTSVRGRRPC